ncbi:hypothetical protein M404DRAFT_807360 [Pisolithus tinctorius Marx 270]|uniref:Hydrophobin n=1 Tax=Pisolithus tinctorius Marx 270 TaxID=870435 RepID=A0A0C3JQ29_PISTI|nr:hypothetical protein M404DRAFT_807360 [Pisolithus tinctorius Marx 270]
MHLFPLSRILAVLVAVVVSSAINPDIDAANNVCLPCFSLGTTCLAPVPNLCCSGVCRQTPSGVPGIGKCTVSLQAISWPMLQVHLHWGTPALPGWMKRSFKICCGVRTLLNKSRILCGICGSLST